MDPVTITDALGRQITLRKLNVLDQVRLLRAVGPSQSGNEPYVMLVSVAASIASIDGVPMPMPTNEKQIDGAVARLDDDGFAAVAAHMRKQMAEAEAAAEAAVAAGGETTAGPLVPSAR